MKITLFIKVIIILVTILILQCCSDKDKELSPFEQAVAEQFDGYMKRLDYTPDICDTLYTEMYIALQLFKENEICGDTVINRVNKLLVLDNDPDNQRHYIEAAQIVYSVRKDYDNFWKMSLKEYETYPVNSLQRNSSLAAYYSNIEINPDSAFLYIQKTKEIANEYVLSQNAEDRIGGYLSNVSMLILEKNEEEAHELLRKYLANETDKEAVDVINETISNFDDFKIHFTTNPTSL